MNKKKFTSDVDLDFADRDLILDKISHIPAVQNHNGRVTKHNTGVYVTDIPMDPITGLASIDYVRAEQRGYVKLDFLNVNVYKSVRDPDHLTELMTQIPPWHRLQQRTFCEQLIHIGRHYDIICRMPEPVDSIPRLMMLLAIIRPAKRHLIGQTWQQVSKTVWDQVADGGYAFKRSHSCAYAHLVVVHMNLLVEQGL